MSLPANWKRVPRHRLRAHSCTGKVNHRSQGKAEAAIRALHRLNDRNRQPHDNVHAYRCVFCFGWHIGHHTK